MMIKTALLAAALLMTPADEAIQTAVSHADRPAGDRALDQVRKPAEVLAFAGVKPGMNVLEIGAGGGYTTEIVARAIGEEGRIYAHTLLSARLQDGRLGNVTALPQHIIHDLGEVANDAGLADGTADIVIAFFALHDMYLNSRIDKQRLYRTMRTLLGPGGRLVVADNAARAGSGVTDTGTLHRIDGEFLRQDIERAGFRMVAQSDLLTNPEDDHTLPWNSTRAFPRRGSHDRFLMLFEVEPGVAP